MSAPLTVAEQRQLTWQTAIRVACQICEYEVQRLEREGRSRQVIRAVVDATERLRPYQHVDDHMIESCMRDAGFAVCNDEPHVEEAVYVLRAILESPTCVVSPALRAAARCATDGAGLATIRRLPVQEAPAAPVESILIEHGVIYRLAAERLEHAPYGEYTMNAAWAAVETATGTEFQQQRWESIRQHLIRRTQNDR